MTDPWQLVLLPLLAAIVVIVLQWLALGRQRDAARSNRAAAERELGRQVAAHARGVRAMQGERDAFALLERAGYAVLERQVAGSWSVRADGEPMTFGLRADYLVVRDGRRYIAEVKTGRLAPRLSHGATRRQLLEYSAAFDVHGVILVDADAEAITHVDVDPFGRSAPAGDSRGIAPLVVAVVALIAFAAGILLGRR